MNIYYTDMLDFYYMDMLDFYYVDLVMQLRYFLSTESAATYLGTVGYLYYIF